MARKNAPKSDDKNYEIKAEASKSTFEAPKLPYQPRNPKKYKPKIGLIACGGITESHLNAYTAAGYQVVALCDLEIAKAEKRRKDYYPDATVTTDFREVLKCEDIEVVDIAAHPPERAPLIREALKAKKHVLSQKPFVLDLDTGEKLCDLAEANGVKLAINQNGRWSPHFSYIRHAIAAGHLGEVLGAHLGVHWNHDWVAGTPFDSVKHVILYDFAIHWFDILCTFMGDKSATRVFASTAHATGQKAIPDLLGQALVEFDGAQATLVFDAFNRFGSKDSTIVVGTKGSIESVGPDLGEQTVTLRTQKGTATPHLEGSWFPGGFHGTMAELLCAIEEKREPSNSARNNLKSLALCFAALKSADTGKPQVPGKVRKVNS
jgi:predicted dehydrogenase